jgi:hypothetical protein
MNDGTLPEKPVTCVAVTAPKSRRLHGAHHVVRRLPVRGSDHSTP